MSNILDLLAHPFAPDKVSWRVGHTNQQKTKGMALAYLDSRDVQDRLNEVCGADWQCEHIVANTGTKVTCRIGVKIEDHWIWRSNGAGETDFEADKGSYSDAFKRAAVMFGVGRYLYDLSAPWVEIEPMGKSFKIKESELPKLMKLLGAQAPKPEKVEKNHGEACGPLTITKLKEEMRAFCDDLARCSDKDELIALLNSPKTMAITEQCSRDLPVWWFGKEGSDNKGIAVRIDERRAELSKQPH